MVVTMVHALIIEDDAATLKALSKIVSSQGYQVTTASNARTAKKCFYAAQPQLVLLDINLPDGNGMDLIYEFKANQAVRFIVITGKATVELAIDAVQANVSDFLRKPVNVKEIKESLYRVMQPQESGDLLSAEKKVKSKSPVIALLGKCSAMQDVRDQIETVASSKMSVFIFGPEGSGKSLAAKTLHNQSERHGELVEVDTNLLDESDVAALFFGHESDGADDTPLITPGYLEKAQHGTLIINELFNLPESLHARLLSAIKRSSLIRINGKDEIQLDVRVITTSSTRVPEERNGQPESLLFQFLLEVPIQLTPLAERNKDVLILADAFLQALIKKHGVEKKFTPEIRDKFLEYEWPGNVRELRDVIKRGYLLCDGNISWEVAYNEKLMCPDSDADLSSMLGKTFWEVEKELLFATLEMHDGDKTAAADTLGISLKTLYNRLQAYS